ncbi:uncharacterized protein At3g17950 [Diospyros lotus]|uniref:uncharacterized protein At3g17950 n=1 Tax=Diospyros lotus TaxID=55363 RepID=UPI00224DD214|nr:uncharacterized protein At3g17950 [Diospyros lotus]
MPVESQQQDGWPLGLQPLNSRARLLRVNHDRNGSISFTSSSTDSSSDLDSQSTGSFFLRNSTTLGSLIGVSTVLELSRRSTRGRPPETSPEKKTCKSKPWMFSLCSKVSTDVNSTTTTTPSLGHFLEAERRAASGKQIPSTGFPDDFSISDQNPLSSSWLDSHGAPYAFSCLCGRVDH